MSSDAPLTAKVGCPFGPEPDYRDEAAEIFKMVCQCAYGTDEHKQAVRNYIASCLSVAFATGGTRASEQFADYMRSIIADAKGEQP